MQTSEAYDLGYRQGAGQCVESYEMKEYNDAVARSETFRLEAAFNDGYNDALDEAENRGMAGAYLDY